MISTYELMKMLINCCGGECLSNVIVAYFNDEKTKRNKVIYVEDNVGKLPATFNISIRGVPNNGKSTTEIAKNVLEFFSQAHTMKDDNDKEYIVTAFISPTLTFDGVDDSGRTSVSGQVTIKSIREVK